MRVLFALFSLSICLSLAHSSNLPGGTREEAKKAIISSLRARAHVNHEKYGPLEYSTHYEKDQEICSKHCIAKAGDARCNEECYTVGCAFDGGDCPSRAFRDCSELQCPDDGRCDSACFLNSCTKSGCELGGRHHEYLHFFSPYLSPMTIFKGFPEMEERIQKETGLVVKLAMLYGIHDGKPEPFARLWPIYPRRNNYSESMGYFRVERGFVAPNDTKTLDILERMGGANFVSQVSPLILGENQIAAFEPFSRSFDDEREKRQMEKKKEMKKEKTMKKVFRLDY